MYLAKVIGNVTARMRLPGLDAQKLLMLQPVDFLLQPIRFTLIAADVTGAGAGSLVAFVEGREAANPFDPPLPIDACVVAIIDDVDYRPAEAPIVAPEM